MLCNTEMRELRAHRIKLKENSRARRQRLSVSCKQLEGIKAIASAGGSGFESNCS